MTTADIQLSEVVPEQWKGGRDDDDEQGLQDTEVLVANLSDALPQAFQLVKMIMYISTFLCYGMEEVVN